MKRLERLVTIDEAVKSLAKALSETIDLTIEEVDLVNALGRVSAVDILAQEDRPRQDISAVDGYAVRSIDVIGASYFNPVELLLDEIVIRPGQRGSRVTLRPGQAIRVYTGGEIPSGADAVIMDEEIEVGDGKIYVYRQVPQGYNIVRRGEDYGKGDILVEKARVIDQFMVAALASSGIQRVKTYRKIRISVIAIGDELVEPGEESREDCIYNTTAYLVIGFLMRHNLFNVRYKGIVPDNTQVLARTIEDELEHGADIVITTGGTGISESDTISDLYQRADRVVFRGVKMRPGRPTSCAIFDNKVVLNLSGFPVAAWAGLEVIFRRAIIEWIGVKDLERKTVNAVLTRRIPNVVGYDSIVRVSVRESEGVYYAEPYMIRGSGVVSSLLKTNGYIVIPSDTEGYEKGSTVKVYLYD